MNTKPAVKFEKFEAEEGMSTNVAALEGNTSNYYDWNLEVFGLEKGKRILDLGCGPGMYFENIMKYEPARYVAVDYSETYVERMRDKIQSLKLNNCHTLVVDVLDQADLAQLSSEKFDYILMFDVLEHIENDTGALKNICSLMKNCGGGATFCLRVPALQFIYGENDRAIGHYRRYYKKDLKELFESCGFKVELIRYQNLPGVLPWYLIGRVKKRTLAVSEGESKLFDKVVPFIKPIEKIIPPPLGLSVYCKCTPR